MLRVAFAADHGGFPLKADLMKVAVSLECEVTDLGAFQYEALDDYPDFALQAAKYIQEGKVDRAVVLCGSGVGACVVVNKIKGVRAGLCHDTYSAHQGVEHDSINILCLGARIIGVELAKEIVRSFLQAEFTGEERHVRRLAKVSEIESAG